MKQSLSRFFVKTFSKVKERILSFYSEGGENAREYAAVLLLSISVASLWSGYVIFRDYVPRKELVVTFFDVGQGDGIYIESPLRTKVLIDGGPSRVVVTKLSKTLPFFERKLDVVMPTHADADHVFGGVQSVLMYGAALSSTLHASSSTELDDAYVSAVQNSKAFDMRAGNTMDLGGGAILTALLPYDGELFTEKETNESSQVLLLSYEGFSFLLTGDLPTERENYLISSGALPERVSVLKLGHHGSKGSSGNALLRSVKPWYAVVSASKGNRYGHPHKETLERVEKVGSVLLRTDEVGDITFTVKDGEMRVETEK